MSVTAKVSAFIVVALLGGVGTIYAPVPTFAAVGAIFAAGLLLFAQGRFPIFTRHRAWWRARERNKPGSTLTTKLVSGFLLLWWLALIAEVAASLPSVETSDQVAQEIAQGSLRKQMLIASFGLVGAFYLPAAVRRFDPAFRWVATLWVLYLCWAFVSLSWSVYPLATARNVVAFALVSVGCFGLGAGFYGSRPDGRDLLLRHILAAGVLSALALLVPLPFKWGLSEFLDPSFQLLIEADTATYVARPALCALLVLVATPMLGVRKWRSWDWLWVAVLVLSILVLKTRGPILWAALALCIFYLFYKNRIQDRVVQAGLLLVIGIGFYLFRATDFFAPVIPYLTFGNEEALTTLTGRTPLWDYLLGEVGKHPLLGAGFAAFWNPETIFQVEQRAGWAAPSAHNGFLEEILNTGMVGLVILLMFSFHAIVVVKKQARRGDPFGWLAFLVLVFYLLLNLTSALIQDYNQVPFMIVLAMLGVMASRPAASLQTLQRTPGAVRERFVSTR